MDATQPIHYRRRWFYLLWGILLLASLTALVLWETPMRIGTSKITLWLKVKGLPARTQVKVWVGPHGHWPGSAWIGQGAAAEIRPTDEKVVLEALPLPVAYRRWVKDTIPRRTADLLVLRFETPGQVPRYMALPLGEDWRSGFLYPGRVLRMGIECEWGGLGTDPSRFSGME